ncbi:diphthamide biosynthesis protein 4 [Nannizzia gypsea CBS 118893]|uniref:Diphthamide biosynthesis protein 4 n=1 Tax=Arthroderma gypseum (strain ATCC MYA-4604 / CBS 118893) TaxID=535722 RepID=E4UNQ0_ARTGP|nr:diphthamide biosynthesis protein 4 [Nannizzia gypsea CBS 118893]EFQ99653.1 diphthamide biosynthesis protein 4 [Nannizzia gypsea CBS 118893]
MAPSQSSHGAISHYEILGLPHPPVSLRKQDVKAAYHRTLLQYHPDKSGPSIPSPPGGESEKQESLSGDLNTPKSAETRTVDQITTAYKVLSNPAAKAEYDQFLLLSGFRAASANIDRNGDEDDSIFRTGLEVLDLDDMAMETVVCQPDGDREQEAIETWYRGCRCGDEKGFMVTEEDLEKEVEKGEIFIGCRGCSLWAKVVFAVHEDVDG